MYEKGLSDLEKISQYAGSRPDFTQGSGGNTSVKLDDDWMAIKASGYRLEQVTVNDGFALVNYKKTRDYLCGVEVCSGIDYEARTVRFIMSNLRALPGAKKLRPSVEAGFHSMLGRIVIHTHSVYANILCCCEEGETLVRNIFGNSEIRCLWIPYVRPGFALSRAIARQQEAFHSRAGANPDAIFMGNHGLIVTADDPDTCITLHDRINSVIMKRLGTEEYTPIRLIETGDGFTGTTDLVKEFIGKNKIGHDYFRACSLFPEQIAYINEYAGSKFFIEENGIRYATGKQEAIALEESLVAYFYILDQIGKNKLHVLPLPPEERDFIKNWEGEKYRRSVTEGK